MRRFIERVLNLVGLTLDVNKAMPARGPERMSELAAIQAQCWGKPAKFQLDLHKAHGYIPSPNGWVKETNV